MPTDEDDGGLVNKIRRTRQKFQRRAKSKRADRRAKARRIERGDPDSVTEKAAVKKREVKQTKEEATEESKKLAKDAKNLIAAEFGISGGQAKGVIERGADILEAAGDNVDNLDTDNDGDTDILGALEGGIEQQRVDGPGSRTPSRSVRAGEPPVGDVEDEFEQLTPGGIEAELGLDEPIEDTL